MGTSRHPALKRIIGRDGQPIRSVPPLPGLSFSERVAQEVQAAALADLQERADRFARGRAVTEAQRQAKSMSIRPPWEILPPGADAGTLRARVEALGRTQAALATASGINRGTIQTILSKNRGYVAARLRLMAHLDKEGA